MTHRLTGQAAYCRRQATLCRHRAITVVSTLEAATFRELEQHWNKLAESFDTAEKISGFLEWDAQRLKPPEAVR
jgi:hypothetical protein